MAHARENHSHVHRIHRWFKDARKRPTWFSHDKTAVRLNGGRVLFQLTSALNYIPHYAFFLFVLVFMNCILTAPTSEYATQWKHTATRKVRELKIFPNRFYRVKAAPDGREKRCELYMRCVYGFRVSICIYIYTYLHTQIATAVNAPISYDTYIYIERSEEASRHTSFFIFFARDI